MKTRKKTSKDKLRKIFHWKSPKRTQKYFHRKYHGTFFNSILYTEPMYEIYSNDTLPERGKPCFYSKKVAPLTTSTSELKNRLQKKQSYVWRISGGLFPSISSNPIRETVRM